MTFRASRYGLRYFGIIGKVKLGRIQDILEVIGKVGKAGKAGKALPVVKPFLIEQTYYAARLNTTPRSKGKIFISRRGPAHARPGNEQRELSFAPDGNRIVFARSATAVASTRSRRSAESRV